MTWNFWEQEFCGKFYQRQNYFLCKYTEQITQNSDKEIKKQIILYKSNE